VARGPDGIDRIWTQLGGPCVGEYPGELSSVVLGDDDAIAVEHTIDFLPNFAGFAADLDGDGISELFLMRYPDISLWTLENDTDGYAIRQELPSRMAAGVVRFESVADDAIYVILGATGSDSVGTEFRRFDGDERVFLDDVGLTLVGDGWAGSSFQTRAVTDAPRRFALHMWKEDGTSALWVVSGRERG
jgi:hypothetical protein